MSQTILFVCFGNIHRSVLAEVVLKQSLGESSLHTITSRGIQGMSPYDPPKHPNLSYYEPHWEVTKGILEEYSVPAETFASRRSEHLDETAIRSADIVIAMDSSVFATLQSTFTNMSQKIVQFSKLVGSTEEAVDIAGKTKADDIRRTNIFIIENVRNVLARRFT